MEPKGLLPFSQEPTTGPYPEPEIESIPSELHSAISLLIL
jgi:hypothetical protein